MDISWINEASLGFWIAVTLACALGAMSPGPSLAVVVNHTLAHGRAAGCYAAISHGVGVGIYALITVFGLAMVIQRNQEIFDIAQLLGCLFLLLMAAKILLEVDFCRACFRACNVGRRAIRFCMFPIPKE